MRLEISFQLKDLPAYLSFLAEKHPPVVEEAGGRGCVFSGAGDSSAAALAAEYYSDFEARAADPYEISLNPRFLQGKHLYIISVSGRTTANIEAAKAGRKCARRVTGITANPQSRLAQVCDDLIILEFRRTGTLTPGTNSFTVSLLATLSRVNPLPNSLNAEEAYQKSKAWAEEVQPKKEGTIFFVAGGGQYPTALYGAAKIYETLGGRAQYQRLEQFSHMELFSLTKQDTAILILPREDRGRRGAELEARLRRLGVNTYLLRTEAEDYVEQCVEVALHLQTLAWSLAQREGLAECSFLTRREILRVSDEMIY